MKDFVPTIAQIIAFCRWVFHVAWEFVKKLGDSVDFDYFFHNIGEDEENHRWNMLLIACILETFAKVSGFLICELYALWKERAKKGGRSE